MPEAQLDRFLMQLKIGYPEVEAEIDIVRMREAGNVPPIPGPVLSPEQLGELRELAGATHVGDEVREYVVALVRATREDEAVGLGASPRAAVFLMRAAKAYALIQDRDYVTPQDVHEVALPVLAHRIRLKPQVRLGGTEPASVIHGVLKRVDVPIE